MQIINPAAGGLYTGLSHAISTIYRIEGLRTLWRGVTSVIIGAGVLNLVKSGKSRHFSDMLTQVLLMLSILALMKSSKRRPGETRKMANTILWLLVRRLCDVFFGGLAC